MADDGEVGDAVWDDEVDDDERRIVVTGTTPPAVDGQLQIDRDDAGRLLLDVPAQARGKGGLDADHHDGPAGRAGPDAARTR